MGFLRIKTALAAASLAVLACSENSGTVPSDFVHLYGDLRIAEREFGETSPDGRIVRILTLEKYGYTARKFDSIANVLQNSPDLWNAFQDSVVTYIDSVAVAANAIPKPLKPHAPKNLKGKP